MKSIRGVRKGVVLLAIGVFLVGGLAVMSPAAATGTTITVHGTLLFQFFSKGTFSKTCVANPDGSDTMLCWINATGAFQGGVSGRMTWNTTSTVSPGHPFPTAAVAGTVRCSECTIAGLKGDIEFATSYGSDVQITGTLTVVSATGQLKGLSGSGRMGGTYPCASGPYDLDLTLPS